MKNTGFFVVFEGIDGCGKSTAASETARRAERAGYPTVLTFEQTEGPIGERIQRILDRKEPMPSAYNLQRLFVEDRREHIKHIIQPALMAGSLVISDRYWFSTLAYGMLSGSLAEYIELHHKILGVKFPKPHATFLIDTPSDVALRRIVAERRKPEHFERIDRLERIRSNYRSIAEAGLNPVYRIDGTVPSATVADAIWNILTPLLQKHFGR